MDEVESAIALEVIKSVFELSFRIIIEDGVGLKHNKLNTDWFVKDDS